MWFWDVVGLVLYMNYNLIFKTKTVVKDRGLEPLLCEVSVDKSNVLSMGIAQQ